MQAVEDLGQRQRGHPRGGQFDRQRHAVELRLVIVYLMLAMMVTSCGHKSVSSAPTNITEAPTAASTPGSRPLTLDPARTALLVMDMGQFVIGMVGRAAEATLAHTSAAEHTSRQAGVSVVFVATSFAPGYPEISPNDKAFAGIAGASARRSALSG